MYSNNGTNIAGWFDAHGTGGTYFAAVFNRGNVVANETGGDFDFRIEGQTDNDLLFADASADYVGIGTNSPGYKLDVAGDIHFSGAIYNSGALQHADYVFETYFDGYSEFVDDYKMMPLNQLELFLKKNKHLPRLQSRADVLKNGWNVTEGIRDNLEKVEELFLHAIEASKKIETLQSENATLKSQLNQTLNAIEDLQKRLSELEKQN